MTHKKGKVLFVYEEKKQMCEYCGKVSECRPYGKNNAEICFECAMKPENKDYTESTFLNLLYGNKA